MTRSYRSTYTARADNGNGDTGTGFVFLWEEPDAVLNTLRWAIETYRYRSDVFRRMQRRAMQIDFSWDKSAREYVALYERAIARHKGVETTQVGGKGLEPLTPSV